MTATRVRSPNVVLAVGGVVALAAGFAVALYPTRAVELAAAAGVLVWLVTRTRATVATVTCIGSIVLVVAFPLLRLPAGFTWANYVVLVALGLLAVVAYARCRPTVLGPFVAAAAILAGAVAVQSQHDDGGRWQAVAVLAVPVLAGIVLGGAAAATGVLKRVGVGIVVIAVAEAGYAIYEAVAGADPLWRGAVLRADGTTRALANLVIEGFPRAQGSFGQPLLLASFLLVGLVITLRLTSLTRTVRALICLVLLSGILASGSRNALVISGVVVLLLAGKRSVVGRTAFVVAGGVIALLFTLPEVTGYFDSVAATGSYTHRAGTLDSVDNLLVKRDGAAVWFGDGPASTPRLFSQGVFPSDGLLAIDNQLVAFLASIGVVGLLAIMWLLIASVRQSTGTVRAILLVLLSQFLMFDALAWPASSLLLWVAVGAAWAQRSQTSSITASSMTADRQCPAPARRSAHPALTPPAGVRR